MIGMKARADRAFESLPKYVESAREAVTHFGLLASEALGAAAYEHVVDPSSDRIPVALLLAAQVKWALFATALSPAGPVEVNIGEGEPVVFATAPDESYVNIGDWMDAFFLNAICCRVDALKGLCRVPNELLQRSSSKGSDFHYLYKDALCAYVNRESDQLVEKILAALDATNPSRPDILDARYTLSLVVPELEVLIYLVSRDPRYGDAVLRAVQRHKEYWSTPQTNSRRFKGFISIPLTGLAALGRDRGLTHDVESPYLPMNLIDFFWPN